MNVDADMIRMSNSLSSDPVDYYDLSSASVILKEQYDTNRPGSFAVDDNPTSNGGQCAVAKKADGSDTIIEIDMDGFVNVQGIQVVSRSDCCRKYPASIIPFQCLHFLLKRQQVESGFFCLLFCRHSTAVF